MLLFAPRNKNAHRVHCGRFSQHNLDRGLVCYTDLKPRRLPPPDNFVFHKRPVMQRFRIEVCTIWPLKAARIIDQTNALEQRGITQRTKDRAVQDRLKVDHLLGFVIEAYVKGVIANNRKIGNTHQSMGSHSDSPFNLERKVAPTRPLPIFEQFFLMNFRPAKHDVLLSSR